MGLGKQLVFYKNNLKTGKWKHKKMWKAADKNTKYGRTKKYRRTVPDFVEWCDGNCFSKQEKMIIV